MERRPPRLISKALNNTQNCTVLNNIAVEHIIENTAMTNSAREQLEDDMVLLKKSSKCGLAHWGCKKKIMWTRLEVSDITEEWTLGLLNLGGGCVQEKRKRIVSVSVEGSGICPMCMVVMEMRVLQEHAASCDG